MHHQAPRSTYDGLPQEKQDRYVKDFDEILSSRKNSISYWDEPTIVSTVQNEALQGLCEVLPKQKTMSNVSAMRPEKKESLRCDFCGKGFINQSELNNHLEVMHDLDEQHECSATQESAGQNSSGHSPEEPYADRGEVTIKPRARIPDDQTIKAVPIPVTTALLNSLDSSASEELTESMDGLSISQARESSPSEMSFADTTYTIDDVDSQTISDVAERNSPGIHEPVRILICLFMKLFLDFSQRFNAGVREHMPFTGGSSHQGLAKRSAESLVSSSVASSQVSGVKRQRDRDDNEDDQERKNNKLRRRSEQAGPENVLPLACPFNKFNNQIFGVDGSHAYHVCSTFSDVKTAYFKQHLIRTHCMPEYHCDRCGLDCKNPAALRAHRRLDPPCALKELDKLKIMPEVQDELGLKTRNTIKTDRMTYWFRVYDMVFGRQSRIDRSITPYYEGPLHEHLNSFMRFSQVRLPDVIRQARENLGFDPETYNEHEGQLGRQILQEAGQSFMTTMRSLQAPNLRERQLQNLASTAPADSGEQDVAVKEEPRRIERRQPSNEPIAVEPWPANVGADLQSTTGVHLHPHMPPRSISLPTRSAAPAPLPAPSAYGYQQQIEPSSYYNLLPSDFEHAPFLTGTDFEAVIEDPDMYGPGNLTQNDLEGYTFVNNPSGN